jgi:hypothetical protein
MLHGFDAEPCSLAEKHLQEEKKKQAPDRARWGYLAPRFI